MMTNEQRVLYPKTHEEAEELKRSYAKARKIEKMHLLYGPHPPDRCGDCIHLLVNRRSRSYFECKLYGVAMGPVTDWRKSNQACDKFERRESDGPVA